MTADLVEGILAAVAACTDPLHARLLAVEAQLKETESTGTKAAGAVVFRGPWRDGESYRAGETVVRGGSLWIAERTATASDIPGGYGDAGEDEARSAWRLAAKRGKDASAGLERRVKALEDRGR